MKQLFLFFILSCFSFPTILLSMNNQQAQENRCKNFLKKYVCCCCIPHKKAPSYKAHMAYNEGADKINQDSPLSRIHRTTKEQIFFPQKVLLSTTEAAPLSEHDFENNLKKKGWRLSISSDNRKNSLSKSNQSSDLNTSNFVQVIVDQTRKPDPTVAICSTLAT